MQKVNSPTLYDDLQQLQLMQALYKQHGSYFHQRHNPTMKEALHDEASYQQKTIQGVKQKVIKSAL